ncbi:MAG: hypothetical protein EOP46_18250 [Sphingobacteriaceae bacterium]|nr:MAG: hypothetical protein EOP46_18250 [Sphingobacteriaceae bacterium]
MTDITPAEKDGKYKFTISYSERELSCEVEKEQNTLHVTIDNNMHATLKIDNEGNVTQTDGAAIPASTIEYIKKQVFGHV